MHIAVEGLDGSGKTTLIDAIAQLARVPVRVFHLPDEGHCCGRELVDSIGLTRSADPPEVMALAFAANRLSQRHEIADASESGLAISDRDLLSGYVYQALQGVARDWLHAINSKCPPPSLTVLLDTSPSICRERVHARKRPVEMFERDFDRTRELFIRELEFARRAGLRVLRLDGSEDPLSLASQVLRSMVESA